jgi:hypothetical protein
MHFLKNWDMFKVPLDTYFHRNIPTKGETEQVTAMGSYFGGSLTIVFVSMMSFYFAILVAQTLDGGHDVFHTSRITNEFQGDDNLLNLTNTKFYPYITFAQQS